MAILWALNHAAPSGPKVLFLLGDSRTNQSDWAGTRWSSLLSLSGVTVINYAVSGTGLTYASTTALAAVAAYASAHPTSRLYTVVGTMGFNDALRGFGGANAEAEATNYANHVGSDLLAPLRAVSNMQKIGMVTEMSGNNANSSHTDNRPYYNAILRTSTVGGQSIDALVDLAGTTLDDETSFVDNPSHGYSQMWVDAVHQGDLGDVIIAGVANPILATMVA